MRTGLARVLLVYVLILHTVVLATFATILTGEGFLTVDAANTLGGGLSISGILLLFVAIDSVEFDDETIEAGYAGLASIGLVAVTVTSAWGMSTGLAEYAVVVGGSLSVLVWLRGAVIQWRAEFRRIDAWLNESFSLSLGGDV